MTNNVKTFILTVCLVIFCITTHAQSITSISGNVTNANNEALFGNAMIISWQDSSIITGTSFLEGRFELLKVDAQKVLLKLTSLEFQDTYITVEYEGNKNIDLGDVVVIEAANELEEVTVVAKSALVREKADGSIEVNVANTTLATSTSVCEILTRSPSIIANADGEIEVFGKGTAILFIDGVRVANERLSTLSPSNIEKIEIISNPGPRYDAEGNAVINIITKGNADEGARGAIKNYLSHTEFAGFENRTDIDYRYVKGKWSMRSNYGLLVGKDRMTLKTTRTRDETGDFFSSDLITDWQYQSENYSNYGLGIQYDFNPDRYLSLDYTGSYEKLGGNQLSENTITIGNDVGQYNSTVALDDLTLKNTFNANYYAEIDTLGSNLFVGGQYSAYQEDFDNDIREFSTANGGESNLLINNTGESNIRIFSIQLDYTQALQHGHRLAFGAKLGHVNINANTAFFDVDENGMRMRNEVLSSDFGYDENIPAGYIDFTGQINGRVNYRLGARAELTDYTLSTGTNKGKVIKDRYINVFPNASIDTKLSDNFSVYFTYSSRINRPSYQSLNPFVIYQDAFTSIQGNPNIVPAKVHALEAGGAMRDWSLKIGYNYTIDAIDGGAFQSEDNPNVYILQRTNISHAHGYFASLSKNVNAKWWRSINTVSVSYDRLIDNTGLFDIISPKPYYYIYSQNSVDFRDWVTIYLTGWYTSDRRDGINLARSQSSVNVGLEKKLWKETITGNFAFNDIFYSVRAAGEYRLGTTDIIYERKFTTSYIRLSVAYNFGNLKKSNYQNKDVGASETQRAQ